MGLDLNKIYGTDKEASENGKWFEVGDGAEVLLARANNKRFQKKHKALQKPYIRKIRNGTIDPNLEEELSVKAAVGTILLDWKDMILDNKLVKYSDETAIKVLLEFPDFASDIADISVTMESFKIEDTEDARKN
jgi:hypothetical protein